MLEAEHDGPGLDGDATNSINGLMQMATAFSYTPAASDNGMDVIAHAIGQLMGKGYAVDGIILNSADYTLMRLLKSTTNQYLFMGAAGTNADEENIWDATPALWNVPTIISPSMAAGSFIVGAFQQSSIVFSRELLTIEIAFQNEDDFLRNLVCLRGELRTGLALPVPAGVLVGTLPAGSMAAAQAPHANAKK
jgi:HK97 family phage major capsid protein